MNKNNQDPAVSRYLDDVTEQIAYKPLRPSIRQELEAHIEDKIDEYQEYGASPAKARQQALHDMGDALTIGTELNQIHRIQKAPGLTLATILMLLAGFALSVFIQWPPERMVNILHHYVPGGILLILTVLKGYPFMIRHRKVLAISFILLYLIQIVVFILFYYYDSWLGIEKSAHYATLAFCPILATLLYCSRKNQKKPLLAGLGIISAWLVFIYWSEYYIENTAAAILIISTLCTVYFMIHQEILPGRKKQLYSATLTAAILLGSPLFLSAGGRAQLKVFLTPESTINHPSNYAYTSFLIQELLPKTPLTHGLQLSSNELLAYGTGEWYFASRDPLRIKINYSELTTEHLRQEYEEQISELLERGGQPTYTTLSADNVTLSNILRGGHDHNNYLITLCILHFGWLAGLILLMIIAMFYIFMFSIIFKIHGYLASSVAFACGQCLFWQGIFYTLGNFGHHYSQIPDLPLISDGSFSMIFNLMLLGLIFSAYRHDHVMEEPLELSSATVGPKDPNMPLPC